MTKAGSSLQLNRAADYAIRAMIHLAGLPEGERLILPELARATGAPETFLSKVLQELCRAGMVVSCRGQAGGFEILEAGRIATIASVIAAVEGPICLNVCLAPSKICRRRASCPAHTVWAKAQSALLKVLDTQTISDLAADAASPAGRSFDS